MFVGGDLTLGRDALLSGDPLSAMKFFRVKTTLSPAESEPRYWLASAMLTAREPEANAALNDARVVHSLAIARAVGVDVTRCQTDPAYAAEVGMALYARDAVAMSAVFRGMSLSAGEMTLETLFDYALALQHQGRTEEADQAFRLIAEQWPSAPAHHFLTYLQILRDDGDARHLAEARAWAALYAPSVPAPALTNPARTGRQLRIGYVAPSFGGSQLRQFIAPLLDNHDPDQVSVTLYTANPDEETGWPAWIRVQSTRQLDDGAMAAMIRADGIDILADCWGHNTHSRLAVFGRRPAPVQVAWINHIQTTGLDQMDYVLHAGEAGPPRSDPLYTEKLWPIGPVFNAFRPAAGRLPPAPTPALRNGYVTFGSFNHPAKLSDWALDGWGAILRSDPNSKLLLKYRYFTDPVLQRATQARFAARGVAPERLIFAGHTKGEAYFQAFAEIDLMLDSWPSPGSTTTLDALSNGVPVLAKPSETSGGRCVRAMLEAAGLPELIAESPEGYVDRAVDLTADFERLDALRARVRPGFEQGPCGDEAGFTRRVEAAFGEMFDLWRSGAQ